MSTTRGGGIYWLLATVSGLAAFVFVDSFLVTDRMGESKASASRTALLGVLVLLALIIVWRARRAPAAPSLFTRDEMSKLVEREKEAAKEARDNPIGLEAVEYVRESSRAAPSAHYTFAHVILPRMVRNMGRPFVDLLRDGPGRVALEASWNKMGGEGPLVVEPSNVDEHRGVLVTMPAPSAPSEAHAILIVAVEAELRYFTLEKAANLFGEGPTMVCEWKPAGAEFNHLNHGPGPSPDDPHAFRSVVASLVAGRRT